jgi:hypothetical protein
MSMSKEDSKGKQYPPPQLIKIDKHSDLFCILEGYSFKAVLAMSTGPPVHDQ